MYIRIQSLRARYTDGATKFTEYELVLYQYIHTSMQSKVFISRSCPISVYCIIVITLIVQFGCSVSRQVLHFCMCNFVLGMKPFLIYPPKKKCHMQKCDGLENIEKPSPALEVTLGSSTDINLEHNRIKI